MSDVLEKVEKAPLFGPKEKKLITDPLNDNNPITVQVLGICSALAVTVAVKQALIMSIAVVFVLAFSNLITSAMRKIIPGQVRMVTQLIIIASLVTIVEYFLKAFQFESWQKLSVFIGLIITNCIVMGRLEAFALANSPGKSFIDGIGSGLGYGLILLLVAIPRELFGKGSIMDIKLFGPSPEFLLNTAAAEGIGSFFNWYQPNNLMVLPASAMFVIGVIIWIQRAWNKKLVDIS